ncbi:transcription factor Adf-1-like [Rhagoletis pomonella]|uniref:transcription factor Adf-1-like n=1 Tax=Rhagoletis pomonella TaxID=28610 RepID=UPI001786AB54|nr:transcription factor Adf-1-like [Rhagoletis pomonella]XP_036341899.1 transcription factor Adf-1-like [Rhagoletis pomonella]
MFEDDLIKAVRQYPCLYDRSSRQSEKSPEITKRCWRSVAMETGETIERCQNRWKSLRDRYVREIKTDASSDWRHMEDLNFLQDCITIRKNYSSNSSAKSRDTTRTLKEESQDENFYNNDSFASEEEPCNSSLKRPCDDDIDYMFEEQDVTESPTAAKTFLVEALIEPPINEPLISQSYRRAERSKPSAHAPNAQAKFDSLVGTLNEYIKGRIKEREKTNNSDFFGLLDTYLAKLPGTEQDKLKADILIMVLNKTKEC